MISARKGRDDRKYRGTSMTIGSSAFIVSLALLKFIRRHLDEGISSTSLILRASESNTAENSPRDGNKNGRLVKQFRVPLPPLAEQKRIVAKVDELMALCDRLEAQQQERETRHAALARASLARFADAPTPANLNFLFHKSYTIPPADLRKSILTLAVQGKLVPQDPNDEPAEETLWSIQARKSTPPNGYQVVMSTCRGLMKTNSFHYLRKLGSGCRLGGR